MSTVEQPQLIPELLPDIPGYVHGIKGRDPWVIQCDGCGLTITKGDPEALINFVQRICFNVKHDGGELRMCEPCWKDAGWVNGYYGWTRTNGRRRAPQYRP